jgi:hypothetical protein
VAISEECLGRDHILRLSAPTVGDQIALLANRMDLLDQFRIHCLVRFRDLVEAAMLQCFMERAHGMLQSRIADAWQFGSTISRTLVVS